MSVRFIGQYVSAYSLRQTQRNQDMRQSELCDSYKENAFSVSYSHWSTQNQKLSRSENIFVLAWFLSYKILKYSLKTMFTVTALVSPRVQIEALRFSNPCNCGPWICIKCNIYFTSLNQTAMWQRYRPQTGRQKPKYLARPATVKEVYTILYSPNLLFYQYHNRSYSFNPHVQFCGHLAEHGPRNSTVPLSERQRRWRHVLMMH